MTYENNDPKGAIGAMKVPLHLVPPSAVHGLAEALADGARKYGPYNWRDNNVNATTYISALKRHVDAWFDGDDVAGDSLVHHLKHAGACIAIVLDAMSVGTLVDDRPTKGKVVELQAAYAARQLEKIECGGCSPPVFASHPMAAEALRDEYTRDDNASGV